MANVPALLIPSAPTARRAWILDPVADAASPYAAVTSEARVAREADVPAVPGGSAFAGLRVDPLSPPHPRLAELIEPQSAFPAALATGVILPLARLAAAGGDWLVCRMPPGTAVERSAAGLPVQTVVARVLRHAATALRLMSECGLTHRAINVRNLFLGQGGAVLGPFWNAPPAMRQPAVFEPPSIASCLAHARGPGTIADDVYALGVTLLALFLGELPMAGLADDEIVERKLWLGSYAALIGSRRLPLAFGELIAAMVADEPAQRPPPERLERSAIITAPISTPQRRINAAMPLPLAGREVWNTTQLSHLIAVVPDDARDALADGRVDRWLRRGAKQPMLADRIEPVVLAWLRERRAAGPAASGRADRSDRATLPMLSKIAVLLDPTAPLAWGTARLAPEAIGMVTLAPADPATPPPAGMLDLLASDALSFHAEQCAADPSRRHSLTLLARRARAAAAGTQERIRFIYASNPSLACLSPLCAEPGAHDLAMLIASLERGLAGMTAAAAPTGRMLDPHLAGFIAERDPNPQRARIAPSDAWFELRLLAAVAAQTQSRRLPATARCLAGSLLAELAAWPGRQRRERRAALLEQTISSGDLAALLALATDREALAVDREAEAAARAELARLREEQARLANGDPTRIAAAEGFGREAAQFLGVVSASAATLLACLAR